MRPMRILRCRSCRYIYQDAETSAEVAAGTVELPSTEQPDYVYLRRLQLLEDEVERGALLEVGSRGRRFIELARARGWRAEASRLDEDDERAYPAIREGLWPAGSFDVLVSCHVLESYPRPTDVLTMIAHYCRMDGLLFLETAGDGPLPAPMPTLTPTARRIYSLSSLHGLLDRFGFRIERYMHTPTTVQSTDNEALTVLARYVP
jgi:hypothetical protein